MLKVNKNAQPFGLFSAQIYEEDLKKKNFAKKSVGNQLQRRGLGVGEEFLGELGELGILRVLRVLGVLRSRTNLLTLPIRLIFPVLPVLPVLPDLPVLPKFPTKRGHPEG
ncbi:MAG: hypothetical protein J6B59_00265 [Alistipes sp.]|nr:hypothetical protein [Alistipes sp.]